MNAQLPLQSRHTAGSKSISEDGLPCCCRTWPEKRSSITSWQCHPGGLAGRYLPGRRLPPGAVREHLGAGYIYVTQEAPRGTGDAVRRLAPLLRDFDGDLLILYGDTPLFNPTSIRGLINRHVLRKADLTLLTAVASQYYPYGG